MTAVVQVSALPSVEVRDIWQMSPFLESKLLKNSGAVRVNVEKDCEEYLDAQVRALLNRVRDKTRADTQSTKVLVNVVTDLSRMPKRHTSRTIRTQTAPTHDSALVFRDKYRVFTGSMLAQPSFPAFDGDRRNIGGRRLQCDRLIINFCDNRGVIFNCDANLNIHPESSVTEQLIHAQRRNIPSLIFQISAAISMFGMGGSTVACFSEDMNDRKEY